MRSGSARLAPVESDRYRVVAYSWNGVQSVLRAAVVDVAMWREFGTSSGWKGRSDSWCLLDGSVCAGSECSVVVEGSGVYGGRGRFENNAVMADLVILAGLKLFCEVVEPCRGSG